jgi:PKD repeat protein
VNRFVSPVLLSIGALGLHACIPEVPTDVEGNRRPVATISSPADGAGFELGDAVAFQGAAADEEDGALPAPSLRWVSSLDGTLGTGPSLSRTDLSVGTHEIRLIATDSDGLADTARVVIGVGETPNLPPVGSFSYGCTGLSCAFTDASTDPDGTVVAWAWDFGDGSTSSDQSPTHEYGAAGTYTVSLTVTDDDGATGSTIKQVSPAASNVAPTADFTYGCTGLTCGFADASTDPDGTITARDWNFGDGFVSGESNPQHTYVLSGTYPVRLVVTDDDGATGQVTKSVTVTAANQSPTANFTFSCTNLTCQFTDASTDGDGTVQGWSWTFGDGTSSTARNPSKAYGAAGTYSVRLVVTDDDGAADSTTRDVTVTGVVNRAPTATIVQPADGEEFDENEQVRFRGEASDPDGDSLDLRWLSDRDGQFGSGTAVNTRDLSEGEHRISFIADDGALADTARITIEIDD